MRWILALVWVISVALVLPYMAYITHVDLSVSAFLDYVKDGTHMSNNGFVSMGSMGSVEPMNFQRRVLKHV